MRRRAPWDSEGEGQYLASVSDLMAGLLFVFVLLMTAFAVRLAEQREREEASRNLTVRHREELLTALRDSLLARSFTVEMNLDQGVLHLGEEVLFPRGRDEPDERGRGNLQSLAHVLAAVVPRYTSSHGDSGIKKLDALFIEGHTDSLPVALGSRYRDNWDLSALRSIAVFKELVQDEPILDSLNNGDGDPILGVAGYAARRPIREGRPEDLELARSRDRRIDLRFVMESPFETDPERDTRTEYRTASHE